jgi:hypothetical protein
VAQRLTRFAQNELSARTCGFESHPPHQFFIDLPDCHAEPWDPNSCVTPDGLGPAYVYLLGLYLGDGMLTQAAKRVWKLRIFQDAKYSNLIRRCETAIWVVASLRPGTAAKVGCTEIFSNWKHWICLFPQHGPGPKHQRSIRLEEWQSRLVQRYPRQLVAGLIDSDGCRCINRVRVRGRGYEYPRYFFTNHSAQIRDLFRWACGLIGVECRPNNRYNISVAKRQSVAILDEFIGPKS